MAETLTVTGSAHPWLRPLVFAALLVLLACSVGCSPAEESSIAEGGRNDMVEKSDLQNVLQLVLDHPELRQYYHVEELPERKPLVIEKTGAVATEPSLEMFGVPVEYKTKSELGDSETYLSFARVDFRPDTVEVEFDYPPEGVKGKAVLSRATGQFESFDITEQ